MSKPTIVYTAIFGDTKDKLRQLPKELGNVECHAFVDTVKKDTKHKTGWLLHAPRYEQPNPRRLARWHKANAHELFPDAEVSLWLDGTMTPQVSVDALVSSYLSGFDLCTFRHAQRTCVYQEGEMCARQRKDHVPTVRKQIDLYHKEKYPYHNGLAETMVVMRRHTEMIQQFNELWWSMISKHSYRDQLSFDYCCWKLNMFYRRFYNSCYDQQDFTFKTHW